MPADLTKDLADTLCTIIALGYIKTAENQKYVYENESDRQDIKKHTDLKNALKNLFDISITFQQQDDKRGHPVIIAQSDRLTQDIVDGISDDISYAAQLMETKFNEYQMKNQSIPLRGAYIGGIFDESSQLQLLGPSALYLYTPNYRTVMTDVQVSFSQAAQVSDIIYDILKKILHCPLSRGRSTIRIETFDYVSAITYERNKLFGSVHGMTNSMFYHSRSYDKSEILELALGMHTCKVASCLPCSLFMQSNRRPATATHLGRGDNWNFPKNCAEHALVSQWRDYVFTTYRAGVSLLSSNPKIRLWNSYVNEAGTNRMDHIPEIFLEALTFEGSFLDKMLSTLLR